MSDDLFAGLDIPSRGGMERPTPARAVAWGGCPACLNSKVGLVRLTGHLVWKDHYRTTFSGARMQCQVGGQHLCELPARDVMRSTGIATPTCPHEKESAS